LIFGAVHDFISGVIIAGNCAGKNTLSQGEIPGKAQTCIERTHLADDFIRFFWPVVVWSPTGNFVVADGSFTRSDLAVLAKRLISADQPEHRL